MLKRVFLPKRRHPRGVFPPVPNPPHREKSVTSFLGFAPLSPPSPAVRHNAARPRSFPLTRKQLRGPVPRSPLAPLGKSPFFFLKIAPPSPLGAVRARKPAGREPKGPHPGPPPFPPNGGRPRHLRPSRNGLFGLKSTAGQFTPAARE